MTDVLAVPCWTKEDADAILQTQALAAQDAIFLATHTPVRDFEAWSEKFDLAEPSQEGLLRALSDPARRHAFCVVQGEPGSGKSHLIRWLQVNWPVERDFCLLIQRADGSLLGALKQLKSKLPSELGYLFDGLGQTHAAGLEGRAFQFLTTLGAMLAPHYFDTPPEDIAWCRQFEPDKLILSAPVRDNWKGPSRILGIMSGGKERNSASATFDIPDVLELADLWHHHEAGDSEKARHLGLKLSVESSFIEEALSEGRTLDDIRAADADRIPNTLQMVSALNARRNQAVQGVLGVSAEALKRLFMELRAELARQDQSKPESDRRRLVLLLEDVTMWEGLDDSLIDALVADATLRDDDICPLISVIGLTTEYHRQLKSNYQQRITHSVRLGLTPEGQPKEIAALSPAERGGFVSRYLSAVRTGVEGLKAWRETYRDDPNAAPPNPCRQCARVEPCFKAFGAVGEVGLFPFTQDALDGFYDALKPDDQGQTHRTPRGMLQGVLNPTLLNPVRFDTGSYPGPEIESRYLEPPLLDGAMRALLRNHSSDEAMEGRLTRVMRYWGDRRPRVVEIDGARAFAGVRQDVLSAFNLPWVGDGQTAAPTAPEPLRPRLVADNPAPSPASSPAASPVPTLSGPSVKSRPASPRSISSEPKTASRRELQGLLEQIESLRGDGLVAKASDWNRVVAEVVGAIDPRRLGLDRRSFDQMFTTENVKIVGTGQLRGTHFVVPRVDWLIEGLEAYARLKVDDDLTDDQIEFHRRRLSVLTRRLEGRARAHVERLLPRTTDGRPWSPVEAATQILAARAWLRGESSPLASGADQWTVLLSDEGEPTTAPQVRTQPWQAALTGSDKNHAEIRTALRMMVSLPQGTAAGFGLADASVAAAALASLRASLSLSAGVPAATPDLPFDWRLIRPVQDRMAQALPRIARGERELLRERAGRLIPLLRGKAPRDHEARLSAVLTAVSNQLIGKASTELRAWEEDRRRYARALEADQHARLVELLWRLSPDNDQPAAEGAAELAWLIAAPAADLSNLLDLFNRGEAAVAALSPHVRDLIDEVAGGVNIQDIHDAGRLLADAAAAARKRLSEQG